MYDDIYPILHQSGCGLDNLARSPESRLSPNRREGESESLTQGHLGQKRV